LAEYLRRGARNVAMEVSSHGLDQGRVAGIKYDAAVFTNLTRDHLDYHGSMEAYGEAKAKLFEARGVKHRIINVDDEFGRSLARRYPGAATYGTSRLTPRASCLASNIVLSDAGVRFHV